MPPVAPLVRDQIDLCFISEQPGHARPRTRQLEQSKARAHAASVAWKRKRPKEQRSLHQPAQGNVNVTLLDGNSTHTSSSRSPFSDYACSAGLRIDPFYCNPWTRDEQVSELLDWHHQVVVPRLNMQWDILSIGPWSITAEVVLAESAMLSHVSLAYISLIFDHRTIIDAKPSKLTLYHCGSAISMLNEQLRQNDTVLDLPSLCTMMFLAILELILGNVNAANIHSRGIRSTLSLLPSALAQIEVGSRWRRIILHYNLVSALVLGEDLSPLYRERRQKSPWSTALASHLMQLVGYLPQGFQNLVRQSDLSLNTVEILCRTVLTSGPLRKDVATSLAYLRNMRLSHNKFWETCLHIMNKSDPVSLDQIVLLTCLIRMSLPQDESTIATPVMLLAARAELSRQITLFHAATDMEEVAKIWALLLALGAWHVQDPALQITDAHCLMERVHDDYPGWMDIDILMEIVQQFSWQKRTTRLQEVCRLVVATFRMDSDRHDGICGQRNFRKVRGRSKH